MLNNSPILFKEQVKYKDCLLQTLMKKLSKNTHTLIFFFVFCPFRAIPTAYRGSQARG